MRRCGGSLQKSDCQDGVERHSTYMLSLVGSTPELKWADFPVARSSEVIRFNVLSTVNISWQKVESTSKVPTVNLPFRPPNPFCSGEVGFETKASWLHVSSTSCTQKRISNARTSVLWRQHLPHICLGEKNPQSVHTRKHNWKTRSSLLVLRVSPLCLFCWALPRKRRGPACMRKRRGPACMQAEPALVRLSSNIHHANVPTI